MKALVIHPNETPQLVEIEQGLHPLQDIVGGYIEHITFDNRHGAYLNDEGKLMGLPVNLIATQIAHKHQAIQENDFIVGPMVIVGPADSEGGDTDVDMVWAARILAAVPPR